MTDEEIIKALANCIDAYPLCYECPYNKVSEDVSECENTLLVNCAAVINHQQEEIERQKRLNSELESREATFAKSFYKKGIADLKEIVVTDYPEMEFYLNKLVSNLGGENK